MGFVAQSPIGAISGTRAVSVGSGHLHDLNKPRSEGLSDGKGCDSEWEQHQWMRCNCSGIPKGLNGTGSANGSCLVTRRVFSFRRRGGGVCACVSDLPRPVNAVQGRSKLNGQNLGTGLGRSRTRLGFHRLEAALPSYRVLGRQMPAPWGAQPR